MKLKLKTKLTLSISLLVLLVVLAVSVVYLAGVVQQQMQQAYGDAGFLSREIYNEMTRELADAHASGTLAGVDANALQAFLAGLRSSPPLVTLFSSAIGYNSAIRDVALVAPDGNVELDSNPLLEGQQQPQRPLMSEVLQAGLWSQVKAVMGPETIYAVSLATQVGAQPLGTITIGVDTVLLHQQIVGRIKRWALYGIIIVLLATALAWALSDLMLAPLSAIRAQLGALTASPAASGDEFGAVQSQIQNLGQQMADVRQVYSALQDNVGYVLGSLEEGLLLFDAQGHCVMGSAAAPRLLGWSGGELVGRAVEELFGGQGRLDAVVRQAVQEKRGLEPRELRRQAGGRALLVRLDVVRDRSGQLATLVILRDSEPLRRIESELEVARRLSAVGRLTRGVAHEVKNPLNAMAIHLDLLKEKAGPQQTSLQPHIQVMRREIERLDRVVRTFLDFTRPVDLNLRAGDLGELTASVAQLAAADAEAQGISLVVHAPAPAPRVWADRDLVEQALLNLVNNGVQAMAGQGGGGTLRLEVFEQDEHGVIRVRDQGPGVAEEHRDRIFDLYFTTRGEGTGIGLALASRIMQLHHGAIELEQSPDHPGGASFLLRFPLRAAVPEAAVASEARR
ncbi:MAG: two-component system sensor histidine kinase NtrB [Terriglobales bacterium]